MILQIPFNPTKIFRKIRKNQTMKTSGHTLPNEIEIVGKSLTFNQLIQRERERERYIPFIPKMKNLNEGKKKQQQQREKSVTEKLGERRKNKEEVILKAVVKKKKTLSNWAPMSKGRKPFICLTKRSFLQGLK